MKLFRGVALFFMIIALSSTINAKSAKQIDAEADASLLNFAKEVKGSQNFLDKNAKGYLIFPEVIKAGIGIGGEYGEGVLRIGGKSVEYYSTASASVGFQLGVQSKSIVVAFLTDQALANFRKSDGWKVGVDGSVAIIKWGGGKDISNTNFAKPVIGFIYGNRGLMYNLTIEGSKFTKIVR
jgi:lipid-binding SYLF domain-containing protein